MAPAAHAQKRPYIGYVYPAGGQQGTTFQVKLGGQDLDGVNAVLVTGPGVTARVVEYYRRLGNQEVQLLNEQLKELKHPPAAAPAMAAENPLAMAAMTAEPPPAAAGEDNPAQALIAKIEQRTREAVQTPACASIANLVVFEVTIAPDAPPGERELRLATPRGVSNPLLFHVGQVPEVSRKPMITATLQVLGKEAPRCASGRPRKSRCASPCPARSTARSLPAKSTATVSTRAQGPAPGDLHPGAAVDPLSRRRRARLVPARAGALRRQRQGGGL